MELSYGDGNHSSDDDDFASMEDVALEITVNNETGGIYSPSYLATPSHNNHTNYLSKEYVIAVG